MTDYISMDDEEVKEMIPEQINDDVQKALNKISAFAVWMESEAGVDVKNAPIVHHITQKYSEDNEAVKHGLVESGERVFRVTVQEVRPEDMDNE